MTTTPLPVIPFSSPYTLAEDFEIRDYFTGGFLRYVNTRVMNYNSQELIMGVQSQGQKERKVTFRISADILQVGCNCQSAQSRLCAHGFHGLHELTWNNKNFFTVFAPGGPVSIALENKDLFHTSYSHPGKFIVPDKSLGHLYDFEKIETSGLEQLPELPSAALPERDSELVWLLVYSSFRRQNYLPRLVPVKSVLDKAGNNIKSFGKGFANIDNESLLNTPGRQHLYKLSERMQKLTYENYILDSEDILAGKANIAGSFLQWEQALFMLCEQPFVYKYRLAHKRYLKKNAERAYLERISISAERSQLQFVLKNKGSHYQLSLQYLLRGVPIKTPVNDALFFLCDGTRYHLLPSLRDVAMVYWMSDFENRISVLKRSFSLFEKEILQGIEAIYPVVRR